MTSTTDRPLFSFGVISDVQYADRDDGYNYHQTQRRYYRGALEGLRRAVASWLGHASSSTSPFFVLQLGDLLDGFNAPGNSQPALDLLLSELEGAFDVHHCIGNHELYNFNRRQLIEKLSCFHGHGGRCYYTFSPHPRYRLINLDSYEVSLLGREEGGGSEGEEQASLARAILSNNPNDDKQSPLNLVGTDQRFVSFNGGMGSTQLRFLEQALQESLERREWVLLFHHIPLHPHAAPHEALLWDYADVLGLLHRYPHVLATLSGHTHEHRIHRDEHGLVHYVLASPLECQPGTDAFLTVHAYDDRVEVCGQGVHDSLTIPCPPFPPPSGLSEPPAYHR